MTSYEPFGDLYNNSPRMIVHERLKNCTSVLGLIQAAKQKGYQIDFANGGFLNDIQMHEGFDNSTALKNHTVRSARLLLEKHPGTI